MNFVTNVFAVLLLCSLNGATLAAGAADYQVTGQVLEVTPTMIAVQKGSERWEISRDSTTKTAGAVKVGDRVTVHYVMTATKITSGPVAREKEPAGTKFGAQKKE